MTETHEDTSKLTSKFEAVRAVIQKGVYAPEYGRSYMHDWNRVSSTDLQSLKPNAEWCVIDDADQAQPQSVRSGGMTKPLPVPEGMRRITEAELETLQAACD